MSPLFEGFRLGLPLAAFAVRFSDLFLFAASWLGALHFACSRIVNQLVGISPLRWDSRKLQFLLGRLLRNFTSLDWEPSTGALFTFWSYVS